MAAGAGMLADGLSQLNFDDGFAEDGGGGAAAAAAVPSGTPSEQQEAPSWACA